MTEKVEDILNQAAQLSDAEKLWLLDEVYKSLSNHYHQQQQDFLENDSWENHNGPVKLTSEERDRMHALKVKKI